MSALGTDSLRAIANDLDEAGEDLTGFAMVTVTHDGADNVIRALGSITDRDALVVLLRAGVKMLAGGTEQ